MRGGRFLESDWRFSRLCPVALEGQQTVEKYAVALEGLTKIRGASEGNGKRHHPKGFWCEQFAFGVLRPVLTEFHAPQSEKTPHDFP
jgi:hypothetical protein